MQKSSSYCNKTMIFQVSAGPRASQNPSKKRLESRVGFEHHFFEFFRFWVDFGSQNGGQNGEKIGKKRDPKKDAKKVRSKSDDPVGLAECWTGWGGFRRGEKIDQDMENWARKT